ncbi:MAG TPA: DUF2807 domain-containing protein [Sphingomicrobium sp.]
MRTFLTALSLLLLAAPAGAATRNFGVTSFEKIRVEGPFTVTLATGVAPFARASGSQAALDRLAIDVRGDTLVVHNSLDSWSADTAKDAGPVQITLGTHDLSAAWLNGSGMLNIDRVKGLSFNLSVQGSGAAAIGQVDVDQLNVGIAGTGGASLAGRTAKMTAVVRGISSLDAAKLAAKDATLGAEGSATIKADVSNSVTIDASGPATIRLDGKPACTVRASGSASVSGCRSVQ